MTVGRPIPNIPSNEFYRVRRNLLIVSSILLLTLYIKPKVINLPFIGGQESFSDIAPVLLFLAIYCFLHFIIYTYQHYSNDNISLSKEGKNDRFNNLYDWLNAGDLPSKYEGIQNSNFLKLSAFQGKLHHLEPNLLPKYKNELEEIYTKISGEDFDRIEVHSSLQKLHSSIQKDSDINSRTKTYILKKMQELSDTLNMTDRLKEFIETLETGEFGKRLKSFDKGMLSYRRSYLLSIYGMDILFPLLYGGVSVSLFISFT
ncbi:MAG: hypothetical protein MRY49_01805 [Candidatus Pacebacteria bacterium]|nr:hypothetical protein [Candidatus Paceibacterota bacterium]